MRTRYILAIILGLLSLISALPSLTDRYYSEIIHEKAEYGKVCRNNDGSNTIISKSTDNGGVTFISKINAGGNFVYKKAQFNLGYDIGAQIFEAKNSNAEDAYTVYHKSNGKEEFTEFQEKGANMNTIKFSSFHAQVSALTLKNGKLFFIGINQPASKLAQTTIDVKTIDPQTKTELPGGFTLNAHSHLISCAEVKDNEVYCAFVHEEDILKRAVLKLQHFTITDDGTIRHDTNPYIIKAFYTDFNMIKLVKINSNEIGIVFQTGNGAEDGIPYGNSGKDLYFYRLEVSSDSMEVKRYDYIFNKCRLRDNVEDYTVDIISLPDAVYVICEMDNEPNKLQLIQIYAQKKPFVSNTLGNFDGKAVKNPQFVRIADSLAILYTRVDASGRKDVMLLTMNYPSCQEDNMIMMYPECPYGKKDITGVKLNVFLQNPYPSSMSSAPLYFRIIKADNLKIYEGNNEIVLNKDYSTSTSLNIKEYTSKENVFIEYIVSRKDNDNMILGKTCKIEIDFPTCLDQCVGCDKLGTEKDHRCFDCQKGYYGVEKGKDDIGCGKGGKIYNCEKCDVACTECYGPYDDNYPTTNCHEAKCDFEKGYFPYEGNQTICFKESEKTDWEKKLKLKWVLFLDKSAEQKEKWVWTCCHERCASCHLRNTTTNMNCDTCKVNEGFYFYLNETKENEKIPGNCHDSCVGDGCYPCESEGMTKMCPCLPYCKECQNKDTCDVCYPTWLLHPEKTSCNKSCDHCYTPYFENEKTKEKGRCVNCKTDFDPPQYTFQNKCITKKPSFNYTEYLKDNLDVVVKKDYHIIDDFCNLITGCKRGCKTCYTLETDKCTECEEGYYMQDPFNVTRKHFQCYSKQVCMGNDTNYPYPHNREIRIGGVPIEENEVLVCLNCFQRNGSFRLPEDMYYCGEYMNRTYIDIPEYHKLSMCYVRCKTCDKWGSSCAMNCLSCRDSKYYDLIRYDKTHGQCYRKQHKCGIYPYYHNYELAIDEDNCGEDCDVCLHNFQCPKEFPYFKYETHECVEFCDATVVLGGQCNVNSSAALIYLLRNPFGLRNPYDRLRDVIYIQQLLSGNLFQYFCRSYQQIICDPTELMKNINNYIGNGRVYNLPESKIVAFNNISIELSSVKLELEKIYKYLKPDGQTETPVTPQQPPKNETPTPTSPTTGLNLSECETILKKKYGLSEEEDLIIIKADFPLFENVSEITDLFGLETDYQLFSTSLGAFLPLQACKEANTGVTVYNPFNIQKLGQFQSKSSSVISNGYDLFDAFSPFYNDVCTPFTNENGNDVLLDDRRKDYYNENINLCEKGCSFVGYSTESMTYVCRCNVKSIPGEEMEEYKGDLIEREMPENFKDLISRRSNIAVFKCASQVFSAKGQKNNYGSYILLATIAAFIGVLVYHFVKERSKSMVHIYNDLERIANPPKEKEKKSEKENDKKDETKPHKKEDKTEKKGNKNKKGNKGKVADANIEKKIYDDLLKEGRVKIDNIQKEYVYEEDQLNFAPYDDIISKDTRSFLQTYWSFLKFKQSIIFTFYTKSDGILRSTKIALFILFVAFYMAFTALFFNDDIMRALYNYKGNPDAAVHVTNIVLSSICSFIASIIVRFVCLGENDVTKVLRGKDPVERKKLAKRARKINIIKLYVFYVLSILLILLCWYYVSAFCAVFKNSQKNYLINLLICFIVCNLWPFITSFIPTIMRRMAIEKYNETLYKASQIISIF